MSYQFIHVELWSRKAPPPRTDKKSGKVGKQRLTTREVFAEAKREPEASHHVENPRTPTAVYGMDLAELEALHDDLANAAMSTMANGKSRKIRSTQNTLLAGVISFPEGADYELAQRESVKWLQSEYGERLKTVVRHDDESHVHLHFYALSHDPEMKAALLHPGAQAKEQTMKEGGDNKEGDRAYRAAMRQLQDRYYDDVGIRCGFTRIGPGKRRLTREGYQAEKQHAQVVKKLFDKGEDLLVSTSEAEMAKAAAEAKAQAALKAADEAIARREATEAWVKKTKSDGRAYIERTKAKASGILADAQKTKDQAEARASKMERLGFSVGRWWHGLMGASKRLQAEMDDRVSQVRTEAAAEVQKAKEKAAKAEETATRKVEQRLGRELVQARDATAKAGAAELRALQAEGKLASEKSARRQAEAERERFRGLWAEADNRLIDLKRSRSFSR